MKFRILVLALLLAFASTLSFAGACATPSVIAADGRKVDFDFVPPSASNFYQFQASANRSYSVEVINDYDDQNSDLTVTLGTFSCPSVTAAAGTTDTHSFEPVLAHNGSRLSFTPGTTGTYGIQVANANASNGHYISVAVAETTIYNVRWSTFSGFITQWGFQNTTSQPITLKLAPVDTLGSPPASIAPKTYTIPAGGETFAIIGAGSSFDFNLTGGHGGYAIMTHNGPPGGIQADAYFIGSAGIVPSKIETVRKNP